jgi:hypothetical protein
MIREATSRTWPTVRALVLQGGQHGPQVGLGQDGDLERAVGQALGAQADLLGRLLAGDVERRTARRGQVPQRHAGQRRLADAGGAAQQHERPGHEPAAQHPVELADAGGQAGQALRAHVGQAHGAAAAAVGSRSSTIVFHAPQAGHCPSQRGSACPQSLQT